MPFDQGIDFRATSGFVTDPTGCDAETGTTANYPRTSAQGNTVGWEDAPAGTRNRTSTVDARLAGIAFVTNGASPKRYRIDLPSSGWYQITLALGDNTTGQSLSAEVFDGTTLLSNVVRQGITVAAGTFFDACGVRRSSASDWVSNEVSFVAFFSSTICRIRLGNGGSGSSPIAHVRVTDASAPTLGLHEGLDFRATSQFVTDAANNTGEINTVADYPHITAQGYTVGWENAAPSSTADRSAAVDARLAGIHSMLNTASANKFRIDLPDTGVYRIEMALGDATTAQVQYAELFDNASSLGVIVSNAATTAAQFYDASGTLRTSASDWVTNQSGVFETFTSTILRLQVGRGSAGAANSSTIAHLKLTRLVSLSPATETDTAQALIASHRVVLTPATESDAAQALIHYKRVVLTPATESDAAQALSGYRLVTLSPAIETDTAQALSYTRVVTLTPAGETDTAVALSSNAEPVVIEAPSGVTSFDADAPEITPKTFESVNPLVLPADNPQMAGWLAANAGQLTLTGDPVTLALSSFTASGKLSLIGDAPSSSTISGVNSGVLSLSADKPNMGFQQATNSGVLRLAANATSTLTFQPSSGVLALRASPPTLWMLTPPSGVMKFIGGTPTIRFSGFEITSGVLLFLADHPTVTPLSGPQPPGPAGVGQHLAVVV